MSSRGRRVARARTIAAALTAAMLGSGLPAVACTVCVGDPSSPLTWGTNRGIVFLVGTIGVVYAGVVAFVITFRRRRAARLRADSATGELALQSALAAKSVQG